MVEADSDPSRPVRNGGAGVCAVVVTFNGLPRLARCLPALEAQGLGLGGILIVDNHSSDGTAEFLASSRLRLGSKLHVLRTEENLGPAGGFNVGMAWAFERGFDHVWPLDDDCVPEPGCVAALVAALGPSTHAIAWPRTVDEWGRETFFPALRGVLVPRQVIAAAGLPRTDFFFGLEDTEYFSWRLVKQHGVASLRVAGAVVHYTAANPRKRAPWVYYYRPRNMVYYRIWIQGRKGRLTHARKLARGLAKLALRALLREDKKLQKLGFMCLGTWHGLLGRLGKTIDPQSC